MRKEEEGKTGEREIFQPIESACTAQAYGHLLGPGHSTQGYILKQTDVPSPAANSSSPGGLYPYWNFWNETISS